MGRPGATWRSPHHADRVGGRRADRW